MLLRNAIASLLMLSFLLAAILGCQQKSASTKSPPGSSKTPVVTTESKPVEKPAEPLPLPILRLSSEPDDPLESKPERRTNRLSNETSPYLLAHAHNPVDWYPWGPAAFDAAKRENKLIFLSIGYSSCYWCHVMERLVFTNDEIAKQMNESFINIKVDREERPDIDELYMTALQAYLALSRAGGGGGWPMSMFLTPDGKPIAGGTYFPPEDAGQRPGFPRVMKLIVDAWANQKADVLNNATTLADIVRREMRPPFALEKATLDRDAVGLGVRAVAQSHDPEYGGVDFSFERPDAPKFPAPAKLNLLLDEAREHKDSQAERVLLHTLDVMANSGMRDHLGGGFHRYSTDRQWLVPHFEKMLYDNSQLADLYLEAYRFTSRSQYRDAAEDILAWVAAEMTDIGGGFYSAIDAESDAIEGKSYVWSPHEIDRILAIEAPLFRRAYGLNEQAPFEQGHVLHLTKSIELLAVDERIPPRELGLRLAQLRSKLLAARRDRKQPLKDDKILTSWNGLMIRAYANAGVILSRKEYIGAGQNAALFVLTKMRDDQGRLLRTYRAGQAKQPAFLDDYAYLIDGLLALHWSTRDAKWLNAARHLMDDQIKFFWDAEGKGFFFTAQQHDELFARFKDATDGALPSANSVSVRNLLRLASLTGDERYRTHAQETLEVYAPQIKKMPRSMANMTLAMSEFIDKRDFRPLSDRLKPKPISDAPAADPVGTTVPQPASTAPPPAALTEPTPTGNKATEASSLPASTTDKIAKDYVSAKAFLSANKLSKKAPCRIAIVLEVEPDWHINANPASDKLLIPTTVTLKSKHGTRLLNLRYPVGREFQTESVKYAARVYEGQVTFFGELHVDAATTEATEEFELHIKYQACNDDRCERPRILKFAGKVAIAAAEDSIDSINAAIFE